MIGEMSFGFLSVLTCFPLRTLSDFCGSRTIRGSFRGTLGTNFLSRTKCLPFVHEEGTADGETADDEEGAGTTEALSEEASGMKTGWARFWTPPAGNEADKPRSPIGECCETTAPTGEEAAAATADANEDESMMAGSKTWWGAEFEGEEATTDATGADSDATTAGPAVPIKLLKMLLPCFFLVLEWRIFFLLNLKMEEVGRWRPVKKKLFRDLLSSSPDELDVKDDGEDAECDATTEGDGSLSPWADGRTFDAAKLLSPVIWGDTNRGKPYVLMSDWRMEAIDEKESGEENCACCCMSPKRFEWWWWWRWRWWSFFTVSSGGDVDTSLLSLSLLVSDVVAIVVEDGFDIESFLSVFVSPGPPSDSSITSMLISADEVRVVRRRRKVKNRRESGKIFILIFDACYIFTAVEQQEVSWDCWLRKEKVDQSDYRKELSKIEMMCWSISCFGWRWWDDGGEDDRDDDEGWESGV